MITVIITVNDLSGRNMRATVSRSGYNTLVKNEKITGFIRFTVDVEDDDVAGRNDFRKVRNMLRGWKISLY